MADRVRIGTCSGPAEAALVRSLMAAHEIRATIGGEQHASMLGGLGGAMLTLDIWVDADDAEQAAALLADQRVEDRSVSLESAEPTAPDPFGDDDYAAMEAAVVRRRRTGVAVLLATCVTFGTAHLFARSPLRALVLAAVEIAGFSYVHVAPMRGVAMIASAIVADLVGAVRLVRAARPALPVARAVSSPPR